MRQRVVIAMALSCNPSLLIADEPTTALDVTIQAQILELMQRAAAATTAPSIVLITHDMGVVSQIADRVLVMYGGRVVEAGPRRAVIRDPQHPYTWGLLGSIPPTDGPEPARLAAIPGSPDLALGRGPRPLPVRAALPLRVRRVPASSHALVSTQARRTPTPASCPTPSDRASRLETSVTADWDDGA